MNCCDNDKVQNQTTPGLKGWIAGPRGKWLAAALVVGLGLILGWESLVVLGVAPLLLSLLPCLVMCGLGLCMARFRKKPSNNDNKETDDMTDPTVKVTK